MAESSLLFFVLWQGAHHGFFFHGRELIVFLFRGRELIIFFVSWQGAYHGFLFYGRELIIVFYCMAGSSSFFCFMAGSSSLFFNII